MSLNNYILSVTSAVSHWYRPVAKSIRYKLCLLRQLTATLGVPPKPVTPSRCNISAKKENCVSPSKGRGYDNAPLGMGTRGSSSNTHHRLGPVRVPRIAPNLPLRTLQYSTRRKTKDSSVHRANASTTRGIRMVDTQRTYFYFEVNDPQQFVHNKCQLHLKIEST